MTSARAWLLLASGRRLDLLNPEPDSWTDKDLAIGLSRTYRWGGMSAWDLPLSVAQHSLTVLAIGRLPNDRCGAGVTNKLPFVTRQRRCRFRSLQPSAEYIDKHSAGGDGRNGIRRIEGRSYLDHVASDDALTPREVTEKRRHLKIAQATRHGRQNPGISAGSSPSASIVT